MKKDQYKYSAAEALSGTFRAEYPEIYAEVGDEQVFNSDFVYAALEKPKDPTMGRYALPVFRFGKLLKAKPQEVAAAIAGAASQRNTDGMLEFAPAGGFINCKVSPVALIESTVKDVLENGAEYASSDVGDGKTILVEYSSPNIAKPFGVAHLRTTIIGNSLRRIFRKMGYHTLGLNYLGDWGTQFGKMIVAYQKWGSPEMLETNTIENLHALYVRFHDEAEKNPTLDDEAREMFSRLENGDPEANQLWKEFSDHSIEEFKRVYAKMGIEFDLWLSESMMNDKMIEVIDRLEKDGLTSISKGALIVDLHDDQLPPALLRKADGATLYSTRDIAGMVYRWEHYKFEQSLYVVATSQSDHFKQVFKVADMMESAENLPESERMAHRVRHVDFGWVKFGDRVMSTRKGNVIYLEDVADRASELVSKIINEKNPDLPNSDDVARMVGVGAVIFSQFSVRRQKDITFDWDQVLNFEGETGPYLQYTHARLCSLLRNYGKDPGTGFDYSLLVGEEETRVIEQLADFPDIIASAADNYEPFFIASYLIKLTAVFNTLYQRKDANGRIDKIISDNEELSKARMALVKSVQIVIAEGLRLLGIDAPEAM